MSNDGNDEPSVSSLPPTRAGRCSSVRVHHVKRDVGLMDGHGAWAGRGMGRSVGHPRVTKCVMRAALSRENAVGLFLTAL